MEKELRDFFFKVSNYSSPANAKKYIEGLINIPDTSNYYEYAKWLDYWFEHNR